MNCRKAQRLLSAYIDSELTGTEMIYVRNHIYTCDNCNREYKSLLAVKRSLGVMSLKVPLSDNFAAMICSKTEIESLPKQRKNFIPSQINIIPTIIKFRFAMISIGIICIFLLIGSSTINTTNVRQTGYNVNMMSSLIDEQLDNSKKNDNIFNTVTYSKSKKRSHQPLGWSIDQQNLSLYSNNNQMILTSFY